MSDDSLEKTFLRDTASKKQLFFEVSDSIRSAILEGRIKPGSWLPSSRTLGAHFSAHRHTITSSLEQLVKEGWLKNFERKGFIVVEDLSHLKALNSKQPAEKRFTGTPKKHRWELASRVELASFAPKEDTKFNFQSGLADLSLFPLDDFRSCLWSALRTPDLSLLDYSSPFGYEPLREEIASYIERMRSVRGKTIMITNGSQEGIYLAMRLLLSKGDAVAIERIGYPPVREALKFCGAKICGIDQDQEGIDPDSLEKVAKKRRLNLLFLTPTHQFPTTGNLSAERRIKIYAIAAQYGIPIIEDDYDHEFQFDSYPPLPLAANDPEGLVIYVSTFSKVMFPSSRLAFAALPTALADDVAQLRRIVSHQNDTIMQAAMVNFMREGLYERHLKKMLKVYMLRMNAMHDALTRISAHGVKLDWRCPTGGMAFWLNCFKNSDRLVASALKRGVFVTPESYYRIDAKPGTHIRLGYSNQNEDAIKAGLEKLFAK